MRVSVCLSAPEREEWESKMEKTCWGAPGPSRQGALHLVPGCSGAGGPPPTPPRLAAASWTLRVAWGSSVLDGGGVRTGETVWVGEDVRGTSQVWVSEHDPRGVASECGPGVG